MSAFERTLIAFKIASCISRKMVLDVSAAAENRRLLFCSEEQSAGVESMNSVCTAGLDMTVVEQRVSAAHSAFVIGNGIIVPKNSIPNWTVVVARMTISVM